MQGFPKHLNSKADYLYIRDSFPKDKWQPYFQSLLDYRMQWFNTGEITGEGVTDDNHKVVINANNGETHKYQYEVKEDANCTLYRLGFTIEEVEKILL